MKTDKLTPKGDLALLQLQGIKNSIEKIHSVMSDFRNNFLYSLGFPQKTIPLIFLNKAIYYSNNDEKEKETDKKKNKDSVDKNDSKKEQLNPGSNSNFICEEINFLDNIQFDRINFIHNYVPFYIDFILNCETHSTKEIPVGNIIIGTYTVTEKITVTKKSKKTTDTSPTSADTKVGEVGKVEKANGKSANGNLIISRSTSSDEDLNSVSLEYSVNPLIRFIVDHNNETISSLDNHPEKIWNKDKLDDFLIRTLAEIWKDAIQLNNKNYLP